MKKINYGEVGLGAAIIAATVLDIVPGDELLGIPLGLALIFEGMKVKI